MTTSRAYIHACAAILPLLVGLAALTGGSVLAMASAVAGVFALVSLASFEQVSRRLVRSAVHPDASAPAAFMAQRVMALCLLGALLMGLGPMPVAIGFSAIAFGGLLHAFVQALHASDVRHLHAQPALETPC